MLGIAKGKTHTPREEKNKKTLMTCDIMKLVLDTVSTVHRRLMKKFKIFILFLSISNLGVN